MSAEEVTVGLADVWHNCRRGVDALLDLLLLLWWIGRRNSHLILLVLLRRKERQFWFFGHADNRLRLVGNHIEQIRRSVGIVLPVLSNLNILGDLAGADLNRRIDWLWLLLRRQTLSDLH